MGIIVVTKLVVSNGKLLLTPPSVVNGVATDELPLEFKLRIKTQDHT
jgi:hypothetical protein